MCTSRVGTHVSRYIKRGRCRSKVCISSHQAARWFAPSEPLRNLRWPCIVIHRPSGGSGGRVWGLGDMNSGQVGCVGVDAPLGFCPRALGLVVVDREVARSGRGCRHRWAGRQPERVVPVLDGHEELLLATRAQGHVLEPAEASKAKRILLEALHRLGVGPLIALSK